jgi:hypothetical protein
MTVGLVLRIHAPGKAKSAAPMTTNPDVRYAKMSYAENGIFGRPPV